MHSSPITSWEGAGAFFTFADMPGALYAILAASVIICFGTIIMTAKHEIDTFERIESKK